MNNLFGSMLTNFQKERKLALEIAKRELLKRNNIAGLGDEYNLVEKTITGRDGAQIHTYELWKKVDEQHTRIHGTVSATTITKEKSSDKLEDIMS